MIRKLKFKVVFLAMSSLLVLLASIVIGMNLINYNSVVEEADIVLSILAQNQGKFPDASFKPEWDRSLNISPETPFESRYFSVVLDYDYKVITSDVGNIATVDEEKAAEYAERIVHKGENFGFADEFRYTVRTEPIGYRITFLDCRRSLESFQGFLEASIRMSVIGYVIVFFVVFVISGKMIRPIAESYEKQKRFITDAGHEIKTPLTIINANVDVLEEEIGANESLADIAQQTKRLKTLTNDLVMLARMEESQDTMQKIEFPISEVVQETVTPFVKLAELQEKDFVCYIEPMLSLKGNDKAIVQLVNVLMDNALKYSPPDGTISFTLERQGRSIYIKVYNTTENEVNRRQLEHVFERFYRTDASRNSETGGSGIGLSVAQAIVQAHGGKIQAWTQDGYSFQISAVLPM